MMMEPPGAEVCCSRMARWPTLPPSWLGGRQPARGRRGQPCPAAVQRLQQQRRLAARADQGEVQGGLAGGGDGARTPRRGKDWTPGRNDKDAGLGVHLLVHTDKLLVHTEAGVLVGEQRVGELHQGFSECGRLSIHILIVRKYFVYYVLFLFLSRGLCIIIWKKSFLNSGR